MDIDSYMQDIAGKDPSQFFQHGEKGGEVGEAGKDKDIMWKRGRWEEWIFARGGRRPR